MRVVDVAIAGLGFALLLALVSLPGSARALPIDGAITMSGDFAPTGGTGADLSDATGIDFLGDDFQVDGVAGDFVSFVSAGDNGSISDFQFAPLSPSPVDPLWSIGGFSFSLSSVTVDFQNATFLILSGTGTLSGNGFDATSGSWNLTANQADTLFNFSSGTFSNPIPEPTATLCFALGFAVVGACGRRRRAHA